MRNGRGAWNILIEEDNRGSDILQEKQQFLAKVLRNFYSARVYIAQHTVSTRDHLKSSDAPKVKTISKSMSYWPFYHRSM